MSHAVPSYAQSVKFLERWAPEGPWVLTAILPDGKKIDSRMFPREEKSRIIPWLKEHGAERNVYFTVNPLLRMIGKKPSREDVESLAWLHVDVDPRAGEDLKSEQERALKLLQNSPGQVPKPTIITFSGGGYQGFWRLRESFRIDGDLDKAEEAKRWNLQLEIEFGADSCHNVDRIMRLPGTINRPNEKKRKKGRVEVLAELVSWDDSAVYDLSQFTKAPLVQGDSTGFGAKSIQVSGNVKRFASVDDIPGNLGDQCKVVIVQGLDPDDPKKFGGSRSEWLFFACCDMVRAGCSDDDIYSVITDPDFLISASVLDKGSLTEKYALRQIERARENAIQPWLRKLNDRHAVIGSIGGKCRIINEEHDHAINRSKIAYQSFSDFRNRYCNKRVDIITGNGNPTSIPVGQWWIQHPNRREYESIVFAPGRDIAGSYNLWKGFAFDARPGNCNLFLEHIRKNICLEVEEHYHYVLGWMATAVQQPDNQGHTAIVLRGKQGTGKGFFAKHFGALYGRHFMHVSDAKHLVGNFNAHLKDCVVLFADEAFYVGDRRHESVLKVLVTEDTITVEKKGVDAEAASNYVHLIMASNESWVVPAGFNERRFLVLDVSDAEMQKASYFGPIEDQLCSGGYEALLHHLMTYDLSGFDVRKLPRTAALQEQKIFSFTSEEEWWYAKLQAGEITDGQRWPDYVMAPHLMNDFTTYCRLWNLTFRGNNTRLGRFLKQVCPEGHRLRIQMSGTYEVVMENGELRTIDRPRAYLLPTLETCRQHWDDHFGGPYDWPELSEEEENLSDNGRPPQPF